jgi:hypothetical protein
MSLQDNISEHSEKLKKLNKLQKIIWGNLGSPDLTDFEVMEHDMKAKEDALEEYWDLCESDKNVADLMQEYNLSRKDLNNIYLDLIRVGVGQWTQGHFVALSALAYSEPFNYLLESKQKKLCDEEFEKVAIDILHYFRGEIPRGELYKRYESSDSSSVEKEDSYPFCGYCGKKNQPSHKFCTKCGKPLDDNSEYNSEILDPKLDDHVQPEDEHVHYQEDTIPKENGVEQDNNRPTWGRFRYLVEGHFDGKLTERTTIATRDFWEHYEYIYYKLNADEMAIQTKPLSLFRVHPMYAHKHDAVPRRGILFLISGLCLLFLLPDFVWFGFGALVVGAICLLSVKKDEDVAREFSGELVLELLGVSSSKGMANLAANYIFGVIQLKGSNGSAYWPQYPSCVLSGNRKLIPDDNKSTLIKSFDSRERLCRESSKPSKVKPVKISAFFYVAKGTIFFSVLLALLIFGIYLAYHEKGILYPFLKDSLGIELAKKISIKQFTQHMESGVGLLLAGAFWGFVSGLIGYWRIGKNFSKRLLWGVIGSVYLATMYGLAGLSFSFAFGGGWSGGFLGAGLGWLVAYGAYQTKNKLVRVAK